MQKSERIVRYTAAELDEMSRRSEGQTDYARLDALTDEELEASIDCDDEGEVDQNIVYVGIPGFEHLTVYVDQDIIDWFRIQGDDYRSQINAVLRSYVEAQQRATAARGASIEVMCSRR